MFYMVRRAVFRKALLKRLSSHFHIQSLDPGLKGKAENETNQPSAKLTVPETKWRGWRRGWGRRGREAAWGISAQGPTWEGPFGSSNHPFKGQELVPEFRADVLVKFLAGFYDHPS